MSDNQQFCLRWNNHQSTLVQVIDNLLSSGVLVDCTLAAEGQYLHAHKVVLCACSPYLETLLSQHYEKHPIVILKDVKFQELKSMMDYMYKGEVNISQDQLGQFLKAAESLQIKGLTDGGGGEGDTRDVGSTSQKRHEPTPVRKSIPHNQSRSPVVLPPHTSGLTIEPSKRTLPTHLSESQPDSPIRSREGSTSPTPRKRRRQRRLSQGEEDGHADNSCDLPMQSQSMSITSVPSSIPALSSGSSSTITKAPPPDEDSENPESDRLSGLPEGLLKEKIEPQSEMLLEPKTEYMDETNNDDSVEDLTLDDDDDYDGMIESGAGPSHGSNNPNENYAAWQQMASDRQDDAYLNPADGGHRDSQGYQGNARFVLNTNQLMQLRRLSSDKKSLTAAELNTIAEVSKLSYANCRLWYQQNGVVVPPEVKSDATRVKVEERNVKVGFAIIEKHGNLSDSQRRAKMFMSSQRRSFFYNLPYEDQLYLLRKTEHMTSTSHQLAEEMSLKLKLPVDKISAWLKQRRKRILKVEADSDVKVSNVKSILLCAEFACDKEIDEDKALILAFWFNLSKKAILGWYKKQQAQYRFREKQKATKDVVVEDKPKPTAIKVDSSKLPVVSFSKTEEDLYGNQKKTPAQLNVLFEAFKKYSGKLYSHIDELAKQTGLSEGAVRDWIGKTNGVLRTKTMTTVTKKLRENFTTAQVRALQKEYRKRKYITRNEANEIALSTNLNSSKVMQWFNSRRVHELFSHYPSSASKNGNSGQHITERETSPPPPPDSGMSRVVIQKSSSKRRGNRGNGIPAFKVLRLLKDRRRCGNKKAFSKLAKELGLHEKQISSWLRNKQYREQMIHRAKLVYGEALKDHEDTSTENRPTASSNLLVQLTSDEDLKSSSNEPILASPEDTMTTGIQHSCLFNAYKESRSLSEARIQELSDRSNMDKLKIKNWWNAIGKHMRRKNIEVLETFLMTSCNDEQREKLINLYSKARYYSKAYLTRMAEQIGMNSKTVHSWFINARLYELKTGAKFKRTSTSHSDVACEDTAFTSNLAWPEIQKLKQEFQKDATMTDARARSLAIRLKVQCDKIKEWFENRQQFITECSEKITDDHTNAGNSSSVDYEVTVEEEVIDAEPTTGNNETLPSVLVRLPKITPNSLNAPSCSENFTSASQETQINHSRPKELLFKEFLKGSRLTPARLQQIAYASNMDQKHICKWFSWLRSKVAKLSEDVLSDNYRNENLIDEQVNVLESEFLVTPYPDQETKETLSQQLGVSRAVVKTWFANRRYYEILTNSVVPAFSVPTMSKLGVDFKPVITSISSAKQLSNEIHVHGEEGVPFDSESIERDELLNSYEFSSLDFDRIDVLMTEEPQLECAPLSSSSRLRYFEPLNENLEPSMSENLDNLFWYMSSCPSKGLDSSSDLSEADIVVLEGMYEKCPKPTLTKIHEFAKRLLVSEQVVYWWFVQRRNLTKMEETRDGSKVIVISSQEFVPSDEIIKSDFKVSSEKSEKYSCKNISDSVANSRQSDSTNKNELSTSARLASCKKKNSLSSHQRLILLNEFKKLNFISQSKAKAIAADIGVPLRTVKTWFHKRRQLLNIAEPANLKPITEMLSPNQLVTLELEYRSDQKVTKLRLQELAARLNVSLKSIILWFKERKQQTVQLEKPQQLSEVINENVQPLSKMEE